MSDHEITTVDFNRPCPVCDGVMELSSIESEPWSLRLRAVLLHKLRDDPQRPRLS
jgi:hypothetical protein